MSKLDEVQELLDIMIYGSEHITAAMAYEKATTVLRELNKPVQYTVKYSYENRFVDMVFYRLNGICICVNETGHEEAKIYCHKMINESVVLMGIPPITIEQITFVKV